MIAHELDKSVKDAEARGREKESILGLVQRKCSVEEKMHALRFDTAISEEEKLLYLKQLTDDIIQYESQIIEELRLSTDQFYDQLKLKEINLEYLTEERKKVPGGGLMSSPSLSRPKSLKQEFPRTSSSRTGSSRAPENMEFSLFRSISNFFFPEPHEIPTSSSDLVALEDEIARLRASVFTLNKKKESL